MGTSFAFKPIITNGLVLNLDAANRISFVSGNTSWYDLSGNGNNGTLNGGITFNSNNAGSLSFDGTSGYCDLGNILNFERTNSFTINLWTKSNSISTTQVLISKWISSGYEIAFLNPGKIIWTLANTGGGVNQIRVDTNNNAFSINEFFNICVTYNGSSSSSGLLMYKNGNQLTTTSIFNNLTDSIINASSLRLGILGDDTLPLNGNISNIQIYNRVLSATEIQQNYNAIKLRYQ
jgi:hypothetical protein